MPDDVRGRRGGARCPLCKAPSVREFAPFCSRGCRDRDLLGWLGENYRIAGRSTEEDELGKSSDHGETD